jgi:two-component system OmpR family sensor kinase
VAAQRQEGIEASLFEDGEALTPIRLSPPIRSVLPTLLAAERDVVVQPYPRLYLAVQQVAGRDGKTRQLVAMSRTHVHIAPQTREQIFLAFEFGLSLLCIGLVGWWVARSVARPVQALRAATRRMASGELSARVGAQGNKAPGELAQLAQDFDAMAERIEALVSHDRAVLQDLSHELRSPLARLHLILELARRSGDASEAAPYFRQAEQEIGRLDRMTGEMLALSRLEGGLPGIERERVELGAMARECVAQAALEASAREVRLDTELAAEVAVEGSAALLERALGNLISNALKFSPEGGQVVVSVQIAQGQAELRVRDHGPGVPEAELEQLFRPFYRGSNAARAEGHGLGLAIVQRVVRVHGGELEARNAEGGGLDVRMRLPLG